MQKKLLTNFCFAKSVLFIFGTEFTQRSYGSCKKWSKVSMRSKVRDFYGIILSDYRCFFQRWNSGQLDVLVFTFIVYGRDQYLGAPRRCTNGRLSSIVRAWFWGSSPSAVKSFSFYARRAGRGGCATCALRSGTVGGGGRVSHASRLENSASCSWSRINDSPVLPSNVHVRLLLRCQADHMGLIQSHIQRFLLSYIL